MPGSLPKSFCHRRPSKHSGYFCFCSNFSRNAGYVFAPNYSFRIKSVQDRDADKYKDLKPIDVLNEQVVDDQLRDAKSETADMGESFLLKLVAALAVAAALTFMSFGKKEASLGSLVGVQRLSEASSSSSFVASPVGFTFSAFGYRFILPEYAPGWVYFWLLMAAGSGLFISEEALNIWVCLSYWLAYLWHECCRWMGHGILSLNLYQKIPRT